MELREYIRILLKNWWVIGLLILAGGGIAAAVVLTTTPVYQATSKVFVSTQDTSSTTALQQGSTFTQERVTTYVSLVGTPIVLAPTIEELGLDVSAADLARSVSATNPLNTTLLTIDVQDTDPVRAAQISNAISESLTQVVERIEAPTRGQSSPVRLTQVMEALPPENPVKPNVSLTLIVGVLLGLAAGIAATTLRAVLDTRVRAARDVAHVTTRPVIGVIPFDPRAKETPLILEANPQSQRAEAFRSLRTNLQFVGLGTGKSFVVTSSVANEGKSTTAANLAIALADAGARVVLMDADLRRPSAAEYLDIESGAGLTDVLVGQAQAQDVLLRWGNRSLWVLPAGRTPPNPSELLGSKQMRDLLDELTRDFDVVICDAPPLLPVTDAAVLCTITSGALVLVAVGRTTRGQLAGALDALGAVDATVAGIVMTMAPTKGPGSYGYGYGYGYGHGYGYGYGSSRETKANTRATRRQQKSPRGADAR